MHSEACQSLGFLLDADLGPLEICLLLVEEPDLFLRAGQGKGERSFLLPSSPRSSLRCWWLLGAACALCASSICPPSDKEQSPGQAGLRHHLLPALLTSCFSLAGLHDSGTIRYSTPGCEFYPHFSYTLLCHVHATVNSHNINIRQ